MASTPDQIRAAVERFQEEVPALQKLKLVFGLELKGRGDIQLYRVEVPGPKISKDLAQDERILVEIDRAQFNELAEAGTIKSYRKAWETGHIKVVGDSNVKKLIGQVVETPGAASAAAEKCARPSTNILLWAVRPTLSVLIVSWNNGRELRRTLPAVDRELGEGDELIVVDNDSSDGSPELVAKLVPSAGVVRMGRNAGFAVGCNVGSAEATGDLLVILNPDAAPMPGWGDAIRGPWQEERGWAAWQGLVADKGGSVINSAGNPIHFTGIVWAGAHGRPIESAPPVGEVPTLSGACLAIPRRTWDALGGFPDRFFLYCEDVDLSLRLRIAGGAIGIEPSAVVDHEYEFRTLGHKWRWLERNRWAVLIRNYPSRLLFLLAPALVATELALMVAAVAGGWGRHKLRAYGDVVRWLPRLLRERRELQTTRTITAAEFASWLSADLDSPFIPAAARSAPVGLLLRGYWRGVRRLLRS